MVRELSAAQQDALVGHDYGLQVNLFGDWVIQGRKPSLAALARKGFVELLGVDPPSARLTGWGIVEMERLRAMRGMEAAAAAAEAAGKAFLARQQAPVAVESFRGAA
jgi:hypothetical protein